MRTKMNQSGRSMIEMLGVLAIIGVLSVGGIAGYSKAMQKYRVNKTIDQITQISNGIHTLYTARNNYEGLSIGLLGKAKVIPQELVYNDEVREYDTSILLSLEDALIQDPEPPLSTRNDPYGNPIESLEHRYWRGRDNDRRTCASNPAIYGDVCQSVSGAWVTTQTFYGNNPFGGKILLTVEDNAKAFSLNYLGIPEDACIDLLTQDWGTTDLIAAGVDSQISSTQGCSGDKGSHVCNNQLPVSVDKAMTLCEQQTDSKGVILKFK